MRRVGHAGRHVDSYYVDELVQDAITDTALGQLRWEPDIKSLEDHVRDAIRRRTSHDRRHAEQFPHESIDLFGDEWNPIGGEVEAALVDRANNELAAIFADAVMVELRRLAADDSNVLRLLDALQNEAISHSDAMRVAGLSIATYDSARARLDELVARLPAHARPAARAT